MSEQPNTLSILFDALYHDWLEQLTIATPEYRGLRVRLEASFTTLAGNQYQMDEWIEPRVASWLKSAIEEWHRRQEEKNHDPESA